MVQFNQVEWALGILIWSTALKYTKSDPFVLFSNLISPGMTDLFFYIQCREAVAKERADPSLPQITPGSFHLIYVFPS